MSCHSGQCKLLLSELVSRASGLQLQRAGRHCAVSLHHYLAVLQFQHCVCVAVRRGCSRHCLSCRPSQRRAAAGQLGTHPPGLPALSASGRHCDRHSHQRGGDLPSQSCVRSVRHPDVQATWHLQGTGPRLEKQQGPPGSPQSSRPGGHACRHQCLPAPVHGVRLKPSAAAAKLHALH